jgi:hypothetical protein
MNPMPPGYWLMRHNRPYPYVLHRASVQEYFIEDREPKAWSRNISTVLQIFCRAPLACEYAIPPLVVDLTTSQEERCETSVFSSTHRYFLCSLPRTAALTCSTTQRDRLTLDTRKIGTALRFQPKVSQKFFVFTKQFQPIIEWDFEDRHYLSYLNAPSHFSPKLSSTASAALATSMSLASTYLMFRFDFI